MYSLNEEKLGWKERKIKNFNLRRQVKLCEVGRHIYNLWDLQVVDHIKYNMLNLTSNDGLKLKFEFVCCETSSRWVKRLGRFAIEQSVQAFTPRNAMILSGYCFLSFFFVLVQVHWPVYITVRYRCVLYSRPAASAMYRSFLHLPGGLWSDIC